MKDLKKTPKPKKESDLSFKSFSDKEINSTIQTNQDYQNVTDTKEETVRFLQYLDQFENRVLKNRVNAVGKEVYNGHNKRQYDGYQTIAKGNGKYAYEPFYQTKQTKKEKPEGIKQFANPESMTKKLKDLQYSEDIITILTEKEIADIAKTNRLYNKETDKPLYRDRIIAFNTTEIEKIDARLARIDSYLALLNDTPVTEENGSADEPIQAEIMQEQDSTPTIDIEYQDVLGDKNKSVAPIIKNIDSNNKEKEPSDKEGNINKEYFGKKFYEALKTQKDLHADNIREMTNLIGGHDFPEAVVDIAILKMGITELIKNNQSEIPEKIIKDLKYWLFIIDTHNPVTDKIELDQHVAKLKAFPTKEQLDKVKKGLDHFIIKSKQWTDGIDGLNETLESILPQSMINELKIRTEDMFMKYLHNTKSQF